MRNKPETFYELVIGEYVLAEVYYNYSPGCDACYHGTMMGPAEPEEVAIYSVKVGPHAEFIHDLNQDCLDRLESEIWNKMREEAELKMQFKMEHRFLKDSSPEMFSEQTAPNWLTGQGTALGSTLSWQWFWTDHVLTLNIGESTTTEFRLITRIS